MKSSLDPRAKQPIRFARKQSGYALLLVVVGLVIGSLAYLTSNLNTNSVRHSRDEITRQALAEAKQALIGWSATHGLQPGALPCPDTNGDGYADTDIAPANGAIDTINTPADDMTRRTNALSGGYCKTTVRRVGRLPWKTLGLSELRDGAGEPLWYALSDSFRRLGSRSINSNTQGQLEVQQQGGGSSKVIAIIFSPGKAVAKNGGALQNRQPGTADFNDASNYLEGKNGDGTAVQFEDMPNKKDLFEIRPTCEDPNCVDGAFNDQLILIDGKDLFPAVENVVARRIQHEVVPVIEAYREAPGGSYPYAAPFDGRAAAPGDALPASEDNLLGGLLPIATLAPQLPGWFLNNDWYRLVYYRISSGFSGGGSSCDANCLSILLPEPGLHSARMVLVLAGRPLTSAQIEARAPEPPKLAVAPPATMNGAYLSFFFEDENNELASSTPPYDPLVFDGRPRTPTRNDKVIYVDSDFYPPLGQPAGPAQTSRIHVAPEQGFIEYE